MAVVGPELDAAMYHFPSISHLILRGRRAARIAEPDVLWLLDRILDRLPPEYSESPTLRGRGLPIGNLASQILANLHIRDVDHWMSSTCACGAHLQYVGDLFVSGDDEPEWWKLRLTRR